MGLRPAGQVAPRSFSLFHLLALTLGAWLVLPAVAAADAAGPQLVGYVNAKRAAHGFPAGITENPVQSLGCQAHNRYGARNDVLTHFEDAAAPGYTSAGAALGPLSVLYRGATWTAAADPFEYAPIHLHKLLAPRIDTMGAWENDGFGCATVGSRGRHAPPRNLTYTYPADGTTGWRDSEVAEELPFTPGELLGIAPQTRTGPYLYVLFDGPRVRPADEARVSRASLKGPAGPVSIAIADNTTPRGLQGYLPIGAEIIPRAPLAPGTTYTAAISAIVGATRFRHRWSFTTAGVPQASASSGFNATASRSAHTARGRAVKVVRHRGRRVRHRCARAATHAICPTRGRAEARVRTCRWRRRCPPAGSGR